MSSRKSKKNQKLGSSRRNKNRNKDIEENEYDDGFPDPGNEKHDSEHSQFSTVSKHQESNEPAQFDSHQPVIASTSKTPSELSAHQQTYESKNLTGQAEVTSKKRKMGSTRKSNRELKFGEIYEDEPELGGQLCVEVIKEQGETVEVSIKEDSGKEDQASLSDCAPSAEHESSILQGEDLACGTTMHNEDDHNNDEHQHLETAIQSKPMDSSSSELNQSREDEFGQDLIRTSLDFSIFTQTECNVPLQESNESLKICHQMDIFTTDHKSSIDTTTPFNKNREEGQDVQMFLNNLIHNDKPSVVEQNVLKTMDDQSSLNYRREDVDTLDSCSAEEKNEVTEVQSVALIDEHEHVTQDDKVVTHIWPNVSTKASTEDENKDEDQLKNNDDSLNITKESSYKTKSIELREDPDEYKEVSVLEDRNDNVSNKGVATTNLNQAPEPDRNISCPLKLEDQEVGTLSDQFLSNEFKFQAETEMKYYREEQYNVSEANTTSESSADMVDIQCDEKKKYNQTEIEKEVENEDVHSTTSNQLFSKVSSTNMSDFITESELISAERLYVETETSFQMHTPDHNNSGEFPIEFESKNRVCSGQIFDNEIKGESLLLNIETEVIKEKNNDINTDATESFINKDFIRVDDEKGGISTFINGHEIISVIANTQDYAFTEQAPMEVKEHGLESPDKGSASPVLAYARNETVEHVPETQVKSEMQTYNAIVVPEQKQNMSEECPVNATNKESDADPFENTFSTPTVIESRMGQNDAVVENVRLSHFEKKEIDSTPSSLSGLISDSFKAIDETISVQSFEEITLISEDATLSFPSETCHQFSVSMNILKNEKIHGNILNQDENVTKGVPKNESTNTLQEYIETPLHVTTEVVNTDQERNILDRQDEVTVMIKNICRGVDTTYVLSDVDEHLVNTEVFKMQRGTDVAESIVQNEEAESLDDPHPNNYSTFKLGQSNPSECTDIGTFTINTDNLMAEPLDAAEDHINTVVLDEVSSVEGLTELLEQNHQPIVNEEKEAESTNLNEQETGPIITKIQNDDFTEHVSLAVKMQGNESPDDEHAREVNAYTMQGPVELITQQYLLCDISSINADLGSSTIKKTSPATQHPDFKEVDKNGIENQGNTDVEMSTQTKKRRKVGSTRRLQGRHQQTKEWKEEWKDLEHTEKIVHQIITQAATSILLTEPQNSISEVSFTCDIHDSPMTIEQKETIKSEVQSETKVIDTPPAILSPEADQINTVVSHEGNSVEGLSDVKEQNEKTGVSVKKNAESTLLNEQEMAPIITNITTINLPTSAVENPDFKEDNVNTTENVENKNTDIHKQTQTKKKKKYGSTRRPHERKQPQTEGEDEEWKDSENTEENEHQIITQAISSNILTEPQNTISEVSVDSNDSNLTMKQKELIKSDTEIRTGEIDTSPAILSSEADQINTVISDDISSVEGLTNEQTEKLGVNEEKDSVSGIANMQEMTLFITKVHDDAFAAVKEHVSESADNEHVSEVKAFTPSGQVELIPQTHSMSDKQVNTENINGIVSDQNLNISEEHLENPTNRESEPEQYESTSPFVQIQEPKSSQVDEIKENVEFRSSEKRRKMGTTRKSLRGQIPGSDQKSKLQAITEKQNIQKQNMEQKDTHTGVTEEDHNDTKEKVNVGLTENVIKEDIRPVSAQQDVLCEVSSLTTDLGFTTIEHPSSAGENLDFKEDNVNTTENVENENTEIYIQTHGRQELHAEGEIEEFKDPENTEEIEHHIITQADTSNLLTDPQIISEVSCDIHDSTLTTEQKETIETESEIGTGVINTPPAILLPEAEVINTVFLNEGSSVSGVSVKEEAESTLLNDQEMLPIITTIQAHAFTEHVSLPVKLHGNERADDEYASEVRTSSTSGPVKHIPQTHSMSDMQINTENIHAFVSDQNQNISEGHLENSTNKESEPEQCDQKNKFEEIKEKEIMWERNMDQKEANIGVSDEKNNDTKEKINTCLTENIFKEDITPVSAQQNVFCEVSSLTTDLGSTTIEHTSSKGENPDFNGDNANTTENVENKNAEGHMQTQTQKKMKFGSTRRPHGRQQPQAEGGEWKDPENTEEIKHQIISQSASSNLLTESQNTISEVLLDIHDVPLIMEQKETIQSEVEIWTVVKDTPPAILSPEADHMNIVVLHQRSSVEGLTDVKEQNEKPGVSVKDDAESTLLKEQEMAPIITKIHDDGFAAVKEHGKQSTDANEVSLCTTCSPVELTVVSDEGSSIEGLSENKEYNEKTGVNEVKDAESMLSSEHEMAQVITKIHDDPFTEHVSLPVKKHGNEGPEDEHAREVNVYTTCDPVEIIFQAHTMSDMQMNTENIHAVVSDQNQNIHKEHLDNLTNREPEPEQYESTIPFVQIQELKSSQVDEIKENVELFNSEKKRKIGSTRKSLRGQIPGSDQINKFQAIKEIEKLHEQNMDQKDTNTWFIEEANNNTKEGTNAGITENVGKEDITSVCAQQYVLCEVSSLSTDLASTTIEHPVEHPECKEDDGYSMENVDNTRAEIYMEDHTKKKKKFGSTQRPQRRQQPHAEGEEGEWKDPENTEETVHQIITQADTSNLLTDPNNTTSEITPMITELHDDAFAAVKEHVSDSHDDEHASEVNAYTTCVPVELIPQTHTMSDLQMNTENIHGIVSDQNLNISEEHLENPTNRESEPEQYESTSPFVQIQEPKSSQVDVMKENMEFSSSEKTRKMGSTRRSLRGTGIDQKSKFQEIKEIEYLQEQNMEQKDTNTGVTQEDNNDTKEKINADVAENVIKEDINPVSAEQNALCEVSSLTTVLGFTTIEHPSSAGENPDLKEDNVNTTENVEKRNAEIHTQTQTKKKKKFGSTRRPHGRQQPHAEGEDEEWKDLENTETEHQVITQTATSNLLTESQYTTSEVSLDIHKSTLTMEPKETIKSEFDIRTGKTDTPPAILSPEADQINTVVLDDVSSVEGLTDVKEQNEKTGYNEDEHAESALLNEQEITPMITELHVEAFAAASAGENPDFKEDNVNTTENVENENTEIYIQTQTKKKKKFGSTRRPYGRQTLHAEGEKRECKDPENAEENEHQITTQADTSNMLIDPQNTTSEVSLDIYDSNMTMEPREAIKSEVEIRTGVDTPPAILSAEADQINTVVLDDVSSVEGLTEIKEQNEKPGDNEDEDAESALLNEQEITQIITELHDDAFAAVKEPITDSHDDEHDSEINAYTTCVPVELIPQTRTMSDLQMNTENIHVTVSGQNGNISEEHLENPTNRESEPEQYESISPFVHIQDLKSSQVDVMKENVEFSSSEKTRKMGSTRRNLRGTGIDQKSKFQEIKEIEYLQEQNMEQKDTSTGVTQEDNNDTKEKINADVAENVIKEDITPVSAEQNALCEVSSLTTVLGFTTIEHPSSAGENPYFNEDNVNTTENVENRNAEIHTQTQTKKKKKFGSTRRPHGRQQPQTQGEDEECKDSQNTETEHQVITQAVSSNLLTNPQNTTSEVSLDIHDSTLTMEPKETIKSEVEIRTGVDTPPAILSPEADQINTVVLDDVSNVEGLTDVEEQNEKPGDMEDEHAESALLNEQEITQMITELHDDAFAAVKEPITDSHDDKHVSEVNAYTTCVPVELIPQTCTMSDLQMNTENICVIVSDQNVNISEEHLENPTNRESEPDQYESTSPFVHIQELKSSQVDVIKENVEFSSSEKTRKMGSTRRSLRGPAIEQKSKFQEIKEIENLQEQNMEQKDTNTGVTQENNNITKNEKNYCLAENVIKEDITPVTAQPDVLCEVSSLPTDLGFTTIEHPSSARENLDFKEDNVNTTENVGNENPEIHTQTQTKKKKKFGSTRRPHGRQQPQTQGEDEECKDSQNTETEHQVITQAVSSNLLTNPQNTTSEVSLDIYDSNMTMEPKETIKSEVEIRTGVDTPPAILSAEADQINTVVLDDVSILEGLTEIKEQNEKPGDNEDEHAESALLNEQEITQIITELHDDAFAAVKEPITDSHDDKHASEVNAYTTCVPVELIPQTRTMSDLQMSTENIHGIVSDQNLNISEEHLENPTNKESEPEQYESTSPFVHIQELKSSQVDVIQENVEFNSSEKKRKMGSTRRNLRGTGIDQKSKFQEIKEIEYLQEQNMEQKDTSTGVIQEDNNDTKEKINADLTENVIKEDITPVSAEQNALCEVSSLTTVLGFTTIEHPSSAGENPYFNEDIVNTTENMENENPEIHTQTQTKKKKKFGSTRRPQGRQQPHAEGEDEEWKDLENTETEHQVITQIATSNLLTESQYTTSEVSLDIHKSTLTMEPKETIKSEFDIRTGKTDTPPAILSPEADQINTVVLDDVSSVEGLTDVKEQNEKNGYNEDEHAESALLNAQEITPMITELHVDAFAAASAGENPDFKEDNVNTTENVENENTEIYIQTQTKKKKKFGSTRRPYGRQTLHAEREKREWKDPENAEENEHQITTQADTSNMLIDPQNTTSEVSLDIYDSNMTMEPKETIKSEVEIRTGVDTPPAILSAEADQINTVVLDDVSILEGLTEIKEQNEKPGDNEDEHAESALLNEQEITQIITELHDDAFAAVKEPITDSHDDEHASEVNAYTTCVPVELIPQTRTMSDLQMNTENIHVTVSGQNVNISEEHLENPTNRESEPEQYESISPFVHIQDLKSSQVDVMKENVEFSSSEKTRKMGSTRRNLRGTGIDQKSKFQEIKEIEYLQEQNMEQKDTSTGVTQEDNNDTKEKINADVAENVIKEDITPVSAEQNALCEVSSLTTVLGFTTIEHPSSAGENPDLKEDNVNTTENVEKRNAEIHTQTQTKKKKKFGSTRRPQGRQQPQTQGEDEECKDSENTETEHQVITQAVSSNLLTNPQNTTSEVSLDIHDSTLTMEPKETIKSEVEIRTGVDTPPAILSPEADQINTVVLDDVSSVEGLTDVKEQNEKPGDMEDEHAESALLNEQEITQMITELNGDAFAAVKEHVSESVDDEHASEVNAYTTCVPVELIPQTRTMSDLQMNTENIHVIVSDQNVNISEEHLENPTNRESEPEQYESTSPFVHIQELKSSQVDVIKENVEFSSSEKKRKMGSTRRNLRGTGIDQKSKFQEVKEIEYLQEQNMEQKDTSTGVIQEDNNDTKEKINADLTENVIKEDITPVSAEQNALCEVSSLTTVLGFTTIEHPSSAGENSDFKEDIVNTTENMENENPEIHTQTQTKKKKKFGSTRRPQGRQQPHAEGEDEEWKDLENTETEHQVITQTATSNLLTESQYTTSEVSLDIHKSTLTMEPKETIKSEFDIRTGKTDTPPAILSPEADQINTVVLDDVSSVEGLTDVKEQNEKTGYNEDEHAESALLNVQEITPMITELHVDAFAAASAGENPDFNEDNVNTTENVENENTEIYIQTQTKKKKKFGSTRRPYGRQTLHAEGEKRECKDPENAEENEHQITTQADTSNMLTDPHNTTSEVSLDIYDSNMTMGPKETIKSEVEIRTGVDTPPAILSAEADQINTVVLDDVSILEGLTEIKEQNEKPGDNEDEHAESALLNEQEITQIITELHDDAFAAVKEPITDSHDDKHASEVNAYTTCVPVELIPQTHTMSDLQMNTENIHGIVSDQNVNISEENLENPTNRESEPEQYESISPFVHIQELKSSQVDVMKENVDFSSSEKKRKMGSTRRNLRGTGIDQKSKFQEIKEIENVQEQNMEQKDTNTGVTQEDNNDTKEKINADLAENVIKEDITPVSAEQNALCEVSSLTTVLGFTTIEHPSSAGENPYFNEDNVNTTENVENRNAEIHTQTQTKKKKKFGSTRRPHGRQQPQTQGEDEECKDSENIETEHHVITQAVSSNLLTNPQNTTSEVSLDIHDSTLTMEPKETIKSEVEIRTGVDTPPAILSPEADKINTVVLDDVSSVEGLTEIKEQNEKPGDNEDKHAESALLNEQEITQIITELHDDAFAAVKEHVSESVDDEHASEVNAYTTCVPVELIPQTRTMSDLQMNTENIHGIVSDQNLNISEEHLENPTNRESEPEQYESTSPFVHIQELKSSQVDVIQENVEFNSSEKRRKMGSTRRNLRGTGIEQKNKFQEIKEIENLQEQNIEQKDANTGVTQENNNDTKEKINADLTENVIKEDITPVSAEQNALCEVSSLTTVLGFTTIGHPSSAGENSDFKEDNVNTTENVENKNAEIHTQTQTKKKKKFGSTRRPHGRQQPHAEGEDEEWKDLENAEEIEHHIITQAATSSLLTESQYTFSEVSLDIHDSPLTVEQNETIKSEVEIGTGVINTPPAISPDADTVVLENPTNRESESEQYESTNPFVQMLESKSSHVDVIKANVEFSGSEKKRKLGSTRKSLRGQITGSDQKNKFQEIEEKENIQEQNMDQKDTNTENTKEENNDKKEETNAGLTKNVLKEDSPSVNAQQHVLCEVPSLTTDLGLTTIKHPSSATEHPEFKEIDENSIDYVKNEKAEIRTQIQAKKKKKFGSTRRAQGRLQPHETEGKLNDMEDTEEMHNSDLNFCDTKTRKQEYEPSNHNTLDQSECSLLSEIELYLNKSFESTLNSSGLNPNISEFSDPMSDGSLQLPSSQSSQIHMEQTSPSRRRKMGSSRKMTRNRHAEKVCDESRGSEQEKENLDNNNAKYSEPKSEETTVIAEGIEDIKQSVELMPEVQALSQLNESSTHATEPLPEVKRKFGSRRKVKGSSHLGAFTNGDNENKTEVTKDKLRVSDPFYMSEPASSQIAHPDSEPRSGIEEVKGAVGKDANASTEAGLVSLHTIRKTSPGVVSAGGRPKIDFNQWNEQIPDFEQAVYNVVMVGNSNVGKTSFIKRLQNGHFIPDYSATIGVDTFVQAVTFGSRTVKLYVWDTAGQERYHSITKQVFHKAQGLLLMYDITSSQSFQAVRAWISQVQENTPSDVILMLLGNKNDRTDREVQLKEGEDLSKEYDIEFMECSAATGENVLESLKTLAWLLVKQRVRKEEEHTTLQPKPQNKKKSGCC